MTRFPRILLALALLPGAAAASAQRGELCFPLEGWALVARWRVGSAARSVREGWARRTYTDRAWSRLGGGKPLPAAPQGVWLRATFRYKRSSWSGARLVAPDGTAAALPAGTRVFLNGAMGDPAEAAPLLRSGTNTIVLALPPGALAAPLLELRATGRESGKERTVARFGLWRCRAEEIAPELGAGWIRGTGPGDTPQPSAVLPTAADAGLPRAPLGVRAVLDVPAYWRGRSLSLYLHAIPGTPQVYLNGRLIVEALHAPARVELGAAFAFDGRDTIALVYPEPPAPADQGDWGVVALHWAAGVPPPAFRSGAVLGWEPGDGALQPGARQALRYAAEILAVSATAFTLGWEDHPLGPVDPAGTVVAAWSGTLFRGADLAAVRERAEARLLAARAAGRPVWFLTPPTVGRDRNAGANSRLLEHDHALVALAHATGARPIPMFEVFNSALRRQRLWPVRPEWSDTRGTLSPAGSYLAALVILDTLSLK